MKKVATGAIMKQEAPYILEWVAYHRLLGFSLFIADNGGNDETSKMLVALHNMGYIYRIDMTWIKEKPQFPAYRAILRMAKKQDIDIIGFIDADEFFSRQFPVSSLSSKNGAEYISKSFRKE